MRFSLDVRRAHKGDSLLLHYGSEQEPRLIVIDGGPGDVYHPHLRPRLDQIKEAHGLEEQPLRIDVLMVSHVDDDHINGILELTSELRSATDEERPLPYRVLSLWHNSFDELLKTKPEQLEAEASFGTAALSGEEEVADDEELDAAKVLASIPQGHQLRTDAKFLKWPINKEFGTELVMATDKPEVVTLHKTLKLTVAGPMNRELKKLQNAHDEWLKDLAAKKKKKSGSPVAALAAYTDVSVPNLSSIVLLAEVEGKRMLLTGDARGDKILEGLGLAGLLDEAGKLHVDLLKGPHHGSARNVEQEFFERVTADHYVFSGDGQHGNPERETLEMLFDARGAQPFVIHLTYPLEDIDEEREKDWKKEQDKERKRKAVGKSKKEPRENWSQAKHSLTAFFQKKKLAAGQEVKIVGDNHPHVIDLLDPLGF
jgi:beta-lactamase superfamily II metal-dependent hydrolase